MLLQLNYLTLLIMASVFCCTLPNAQAGLILPNGDFEAFTNAYPGMPIADAVARSWKETGTGGHTFLVDGSGELNGFLARGGLPGGIDVDPQIPYAAQINGFGNGIYNSFSSVPGQDYFIDFTFGVFGPGSVVKIDVSFFDGPDTTGALLSSISVNADPDRYGDGESTGVYVGAFTAGSATTTILFTLHSSPIDSEDIMYLDNVTVSAVPEPSALGFVCLAAMVAMSRRMRASTKRLS